LATSLSANDTGLKQCELSIQSSGILDTKERRTLFSDERIADLGMIAIYAFVDENANGILDATDQPIEGIEFKFGGRLMQKRTDESGYLLVEGLPTYTYVPVSIEIGSIKDPLQQPSTEGLNVETRPGIISRVYFPIVQTNSISGKIYKKKNEIRSPLGNIKIILTHSDGRKETAFSDHDGFYIFEKIFPGNVALSFDTDVLNRREVKDQSQPWQAHFAVGSSQELEQDFILEEYNAKIGGDSQ
jgi:hypothetical protein